MKKLLFPRPYREPVLPVYDTTSVTKRSSDTPEVSPEVPQPHTDKAEPGFSCYSAHNCLPVPLGLESRSVQGIQNISAPFLRKSILKQDFLTCRRRIMSQE